MTNAPLPPGSTIGIFGGGQLGRMTALAAAKLGYRVHIFDPQADPPAAQVANLHLAAAYDDQKAVAEFAAGIDVATFEFENVPSATVARLEGVVPVRPGGKILHIIQDRLREKDFLRGIGVATTAYARVESLVDLERLTPEIGLPAVLKAARFGYDGKGQRKLEPGTDLKTTWQDLGADHAILEAWVDFACEISVIVARGTDGEMAAYAPSENRHQHHILRQSRVPAAIDANIGLAAEASAKKIAAALDLTGLLAVEFFVTRDGGLLVNELAPRPHNSGHWTMDACVTSQFEQFVRAVAGLPLGATDRHCDAVMTNLLGEEWENWPDIAAEPGASLHLYGKKEARPGRKMGHVTRLSPKTGR
ncbi:5-(carboxyamino)imidazole ribonucleotide synthase [Rhodospirillaceae bacterium AH-315-P19]|nr:5-(carboxyamino)imidazole ribonucleotide synthase [Rhodospirillaceae bacterium AH-315-P19]